MRKCRKKGTGYTYQLYMSGATLYVRVAIWYSKGSTYFLWDRKNIEAARISRIYSQNSKPGHVVEITTLLTSWWYTKRPEWWVRPCGWNNHHLQPDGTQRGQNGEPGHEVEITTSLTLWWHTMRPEWWARPWGWNNHTTYILMAYNEARMVSQALWLK